MWRLLPTEVGAESFCRVLFRQLGEGADFDASTLGQRRALLGECRGGLRVVDVNDGIATWWAAALSSTTEENTS